MELDVYGRLRAFGSQVDFSESPEVLVPTPDQANEATNKAYVDTAVSAETAVRVASIASVQADIDQNELDSDAADAVLQANIDAEALARADAINQAVSGDIDADSLTTSGNLTVSGNTALAGNVSTGDLSVSGNTALGGNVGVSGELDVSGPSTFDYDIDVNGRIEGWDARFEDVDVNGRLTAYDLRAHGLLRVYGDLEMDGYRANFEYAEEVLVPTPDQANEATNKAYVDSAVSAAIASDNARGLVQLAFDENVSSFK